jgi:preprotein translocase subunit SecG
MIASVIFIAILMTILIQRRSPNGSGAGSGCWRRTSGTLPAISQPQVA